MHLTILVNTSTDLIAAKHALHNGHHCQLPTEIARWCVHNRQMSSTLLQWVFKVQNCVELLLQNQHFNGGGIYI